MKNQQPEIVWENPDHPSGEIYKKECKICKNERKFFAGTERDRQSICGNCWIW